MQDQRKEMTIPDIADLYLQAFIDDEVSAKLNGIAQRSVNLTEGMSKLEQKACLSFILEKVEISAEKFFTKMRARIESKA